MNATLDATLDRQMCAAPRAIDYDAYRARAAAMRRQAQRAAIRSMVRYARRAGFTAIRSIVAAALLAAILFAFGQADAASNPGSPAGGGMKPPSASPASSPVILR